MKGLSDILGAARDLKAATEDLQARLKDIVVEGVSGAGLVRVTLSAKADLKRVSIDPSLMNADEREVLEDLLVAAHADARAKAEAALAEEMQKLTAGLPLPPGFKMPF